MSLLHLSQGGIICVNSLRQTSQAAGQSKEKKEKKNWTKNSHKEEEQINEKYKRQRRGRGCSHIAGLQRITSDDHYFSFRQFRQIIGKTHSLITEGSKEPRLFTTPGLDI